jgi:hypothetical protein
MPYLKRNVWELVEMYPELPRKINLWIGVPPLTGGACLYADRYPSVTS